MINFACMRLTIDGNSIDFQIAQGNELWPIRSRKNRGEVKDEYTSENYVLPTYYGKSNEYKIKLVGEFYSISDMENALHYLFYLVVINDEKKSFTFTNDNGSGLAIPIVGICNKAIKTTYKKDGSKFIMNVNIPLIDVAP